MSAIRTCFVAFCLLNHIIPCRILRCPSYFFYEILRYFFQTIFAETSRSVTFFTSFDQLYTLLFIYISISFIRIYIHIYTINLGRFSKNRPYLFMLWPVSKSPLFDRYCSCWPYLFQLHLVWPIHPKPTKFYSKLPKMCAFTKWLVRFKYITQFREFSCQIEVCFVCNIIS